jgi:hypothetical protein
MDGYRVDKVLATPAGEGEPPPRDVVAAPTVGG